MKAMGGMIVGVRVGIEEEKEKEDGNKERIITAKVCLGKRWWRIVGVYINNNLNE